jgi:hypothetical protein
MKKIISLIILLFVGGALFTGCSSTSEVKTENSEDNIKIILGDNETLILAKLQVCQDNLCIIPTPVIKLEKGKSENIFIKINAFNKEISCLKGELKNCELDYSIINMRGENSNSINIEGEGFTINASNEKSIVYSIKALEDTLVGTHFLTFKLYPNTDYEKTKTITIDVK